MLNTMPEAAEPLFLDAQRRVEQNVSSIAQAAEQIGMVQECRILNNQRVRLQHGLSQANLFVVDAAERHKRSTHPLRAKARERLRVAPLETCRDGQHFGARYHALSATAMNSNLEHPRPPAVLLDPPSAMPCAIRSK